MPTQLPIYDRGIQAAFRYRASGLAGTALQWALNEDTLYLDPDEDDLFRDAVAQAITIIAAPQRQHTLLIPYLTRGEN